MTKNSPEPRIYLALLLLMIPAVLPGNAGAQSDAVTVSLNPSKPGATVPLDFSGLSYEEADLLPNSSGGHYFINTNQPLLNMFSTLGIKSLRIGGNTADSGTQPSNTDIDDLFGFAKAANVKVLYTLRLKTFDAAAANATATYIMDHYSSDLTCLAIGNEPDVYLSSYSTYKSEAQTYINTISASNPTAKFCGPSVTGGGGTWAASFANDFASTGKIALVTHHNYFGGNGHNTSGATARNTLLSAALLNNYASNAAIYVPTVQSNGLSFRLEETNSFYGGGAPSASNTFAEALWDLDYLYWWTNEGAEGLNFHTGDSVSGGTAYYSFFTTTAGGYTVHPGAYGPLAFSLGGHGRIVPVTLSNPSGVDLTAYGVLGTDNSLWVTIINKTHETGSITADLTINLGGNYSKGNMWLMQAPNNDDSQTTGIKLGGGEVGVDGIWSGTSEPVSVSGSTATLTLSPASAAVIQFVASSGSCTAPSAPSGLTATADSSSQINLSWTASSSSCFVTYNVYRSTTSGFTPLSSNEIASGVTATTYSNTGLMASTTYYYKVEGTNSGGTSAASNQASATTSVSSGSCTSICIDSGSTAAVSPFVADEDFSGGSTIDHANTIDTSNVTNPAPAAVYQTARVGATQASGVGAPFTYTITGLTAGSSHTVRLHFAETFFTTAGSRVFNVSINGTQVLTNFDIVAASGGENIANIQQFTAMANASGQIVITFTSVTNNALISGIEID
jgi:hypothetical protein